MGKQPDIEMNISIFAVREWAMGLHEAYLLIAEQNLDLFFSLLQDELGALCKLLL